VDLEAEQVRVLLAEKAYIEQRISTNLDLQQKVIAGGLTLVISALGWGFSGGTKMSGPPHTIALLSIVSISALSVLMGVLYAAFALAAIRFKENVLGTEFHALLAIKPSIFAALRATRDSPAGGVITITTGLLFGAHITLSIVVYVAAFLTAEWGAADPLARWLPAGVVVAGLLLAGSIVSLGSWVRAMIQTDNG
jgi:hypothetical protein